MARGRRVPPKPDRVANGLGTCDCETCQRVDRILGREITKIEAAAMKGYRDSGRGVVRVVLCEDCGEHIADSRPDGIAYIPLAETAGWPADAQADLRAYPSATEYLVLVADYSIGKVTTRQLAYTQEVRAA